MENLFADLEPFLAVADLGSFRRAADRLGVTPAAMSKAVARLEARLGVRLFQRTTRRVALTPEGERFRERCLAAVREIAAGTGEAADARRSMGGEVTISAPFIVGRLLAGCLPPFLAAHPAITVRLELTDRRVDLPAERVDIAIRIGDPGEADLVVRRLAGLRWAMAASPAYLAANGAPARPADLAAHRGVAFLAPSGRVAPWRFVEAGRAYEMAPSAGLIVDEGEFLLDAATAGAGVAQVFSFMAAPHFASGALRPVLDAFQPSGPDINAVLAAGRNAIPRVRAALDCLYGAFAGL